MTKGKPWTVDEEATLKALADANTPIDTMAAKLNRKPDVVYVKCIRLGLTKRPQTLVSTIPMAVMMTLKANFSVLIHFKLK